MQEIVPDVGRMRGRNLLLHPLEELSRRRKNWNERLIILVDLVYSCYERSRSSEGRSWRRRRGVDLFSSRFEKGEVEVGDLGRREEVW